MRTAESFFNWAFNTRGNTVMKLVKGEKMSNEKMFLSFCSHDPAVISHGPAGLNASIKGIGWLPKPEYIEEIYEIYMNHIRSYKPGDDSYSQRGLGILMDNIYGEQARHKVDFTRLGSLEMAKDHSYKNFLANKEATILFYQPPMISFELRGKMDIVDGETSKKREIYQEFLNAQHDVYHIPNPNNLVRYPAYVFKIEEIYDNSATKEGFGTKLQFPY